MVHYNWGSTLARQGRFREAAEHLEQALQLAPGDPRLHYQVANLWAKHGQLPRALAVLRQALRPWPDNPEFLSTLAWQLATGSPKELRDGPEAVRLAERACGETGQANPQMLFTLAVACVEDGQLPRAIEVARRARSMARDKGHTTLARRLDTMLEELTRRPSTSPPPRPNP